MPLGDCVRMSSVSTMTCASRRQFASQTSHFPVVAHVSLASLNAPTYVALTSKNPSLGGVIAPVVIDTVGPNFGVVGLKQSMPAGSCTAFALAERQRRSRADD